MPTHFGPSLGPRQGPEGRRYTCIDSPQGTYISATFSAVKSELDNLLPPGFTLREATVTFFFEYMLGIEWLAGRGYNTFGVSVPVRYTGQRDTVDGNLLMVLWENKADPIITGREDLGFSKLYAELPEWQKKDGTIICRASWDGFEFAKLTLTNMTTVDVSELPEAASSQGVLHYKYIPKTGSPGEADAAYVTLTPADDPNGVVEHASLAESAVLEINQATWEQLPTIVHIVNTLSCLTLGSCISATVLKAHGGKDLSDTRILR